MSHPTEGPVPDTSPVDIVIDKLTRDRMNHQDRGRLGKALDGANGRADGHKAAPDEAFGRIAGRVAGGVAKP